MGCKLGYHILVLPNQVLLTNSVPTNEVLLQPVRSGLVIAVCDLQRLCIEHLVY